MTEKHRWQWHPKSTRSLLFFLLSVMFSLKVITKLKIVFWHKISFSVWALFIFFLSVFLLLSLFFLYSFQSALFLLFVCLFLMCIRLSLGLLKETRFCAGSLFASDPRVLAWGANRANRESKSVQERVTASSPLYLQRAFDRRNLRSSYMKCSQDFLHRGSKWTHSYIHWPLSSIGQVGYHRH